MYAKPRCKGDGAVEFMLLLTDCRHSRVASDHCHDSLVVIMKRSSSPTLNLGQDVFRSPLAALLGDRAKLRQRLLIRTRNVREVAQYVNARETVNREVRPHFDPAAVAPRQSGICGQR